MANISFLGSKRVADCVPVCGYGTYSPTGLVPCLECPRNSYTGEPPTDGFKDCQACPASTYTYQPASGGKEHCRGWIFLQCFTLFHIQILSTQRCVI
jgi:hypothetical protein